MARVIQGHRCPNCKSSIARTINVNMEKYGYDYEPMDSDEYSTYTCLNKKCGACDFPDYFYFWEVELEEGDKCPKCGSRNLEGEYFDYFSGELELKCKDCKHTFNVER
jgi:predicted Zn-ribbon and HTH transcriptional regulator